ncbi:MAG: esterase [Paenibacillaceae bacterium]|nr:esterase [Paenibacillaceae bacterium]
MEKLLWQNGAPLAGGTTDEDRPALIPYLVEGDNRPAIIICPGGGYVARVALESEPIAEWLNSIGVSAFILRYRVAPYAYPCALLDAQRAIRTLRHEADQFGIDPARVGIIGFSAGGHLASAAGTHYDRGRPDAEDPVERQSCRPDLMILSYPVITMRAPYGHAGSRLRLLGPEPDEAMTALMSSEEQVTADTPPAFVWHTLEDATVAVENSMMFAAALRKSNVPFDLHLYPTGKHGLGTAASTPHVSGWTAACASWLKLNGF